jgi:quinol monooxygenase YgiN
MSMEPKDLQLVVEIRCKPGAEREIEQRVVEFVSRTRAEPGCSWASFHRVEEYPERFVFLAGFADEAALQAHFDSDWRNELTHDLPDKLAEWPRRFTLRRVA